MTKPLAQRNIGYWVNGKLVHMPKSSISKSKPREEVHTKRNRIRREVLNALQQRQKRLARQRQRQKKLSELKYFDEDTIIELKNASKSGNITLVLDQLSSMQQQIARFRLEERDSTVFFQISVECIFVPDIEERTALYYASLTGQNHIVELYLSLYLMSAFKVTESNIGTARTFREWFFSLRGTNNMIFSKRYTKKDYDLCVLNSLNEKIRHTLTKRKVNIMDAMTIVNKALGNVSADSIQARIRGIKKEMDTMTRFLQIKKKKSQKKPILVNDVFNRNNEYGSDDLWTEEDYEEVSEEGVSDKVTTTKIVNGVYIEYEMNISEQADAKDSAISITSSQSIDEQDSNERSKNLSPILTSSDTICNRNVTEFEDFVEELVSMSDYSILSSETFIECSQISLDKVPVDSYEFDGESTQDWDVVTDLPSVNSLNTFSTTTTGRVISPLPIFYRDIIETVILPIETCGERNISKLRTSTFPIVKLHISKKDCKSKTRNKDGMITAIAEEDDRIYDTHWERNGYKNGRGGNVGSIFKGNNRTPRCYRHRNYEKDPNAVRRRDMRNCCRMMVK